MRHNSTKIHHAACVASRSNGLWSRPANITLQSRQGVRGVVHKAWNPSKCQFCAGCVFNDLVATGKDRRRHNPSRCPGGVPKRTRNRKHGSTEFLIDITKIFPLPHRRRRVLFVEGNCVRLSVTKIHRDICLAARRAGTDGITATNSNLLTEKWTEPTGVKSKSQHTASDR